ncbi:TadE/TadG family type IV pilus assembly protein [Roseibium suaedae]|uniref:Flp pilus assembly protein TadG n=1 Tax=Roseibium suaedae TaxID=735517 RepID=A0A1M7MPF3_9HYPH|nr:TadE/TadG family type IV pilus assembly protein [Roseibium suaedae]SHM92890.1 Flp pilus assembly protein TadG [Roseibium suaedae]
MRLGAARTIWRAFRRLPNDRRGSILPIFALLVFLLVVIAGAGIDFARAINEREAIATALDASALSVATQLSSSVMTDTQIDTALKDAFRANATHVTDVTKAISDLTFVVNSDAGTVTVRTKATVPTTFINIGGIGPSELSVNTMTEVSYSKFDVELALVLDVTGSMSLDPADLAALQSASTSLVEELMPTSLSTSTSKIRISIVPYSQGVNLGTYAYSVTNGKSTLANCVTERGGDKRYTDAIYNYSGSSSEFFGGKSDYETQYQPAEYTYSNPSDACPAAAVLPLTNNKVKLLATIASLVGVGGTAGQTGIAWGWYTLSPNWSSLWPSASTPAAYTDKNTIKIAIIMTDGGFNMNYDKSSKTYPGSCGWVWQGYKLKWVCTNSTTISGWFQYWYQEASYDTEPAVRGRKFCDEMKTAGISLYTVFFETQDSNFGKDLMSYCASSSDKFYYASSTSELINAFGNIARKIQSIYLAK